MRHHAHAQPTRLVHIRHARLRRQPARFENHWRRVVIVNRDLRVWRLRRIVVHEAAPEPEDPLRRSVGPHHAPRDIEDVHAVVAQLAVARRPRPVPVVVHLVPFERRHRRRSAKRLVIHPVRIPRRPARDRVAFPVVGRVDILDLPQPAFVQKLDARREPVLRAILRAHLHDAPILCGGLHHLAPLPHGVAHRFLDVDILARLTRPHREQCVPMIRRHHEHRVHIRPRQQRARIRGGKRGRRPRFQYSLRLRDLRRIDIAQRDDPHIRPQHELFDVRLRLGPAPDDAQPHRVIRPDRSGPRGCPESGSQRTGSRRPSRFHQKCTSVNFFHRVKATLAPRRPAYTPAAGLKPGGTFLRRTR